MRRDRIIKAMLSAVLVVFSASYAYAEEFFARLNGFQELGALNNQTGAILSDGAGTLRLSLDRNAGMATFTLTFSDVGTTEPLVGTVTQAHIHFGKRHDSGGVMVFFCSNLGNGPAGTPACPLHSGTVSGTFTKESVVAIPAQNVKQLDFNALVEALGSNTAYANIHTTALGAGEIRGQIRKGLGDDDKDHHDK
jgi:CHRD domain-containing protein